MLLQIESMLLQIPKICCPKIQMWFVPCRTIIFRAGPRPPSLPIILDPIFSANVAGEGVGGVGGVGGGGGGGLVFRADQPPIS